MGVQSQGHHDNSHEHHHGHSHHSNSHESEPDHGDENVGPNSCDVLETSLKHTTVTMSDKERRQEVLRKLKAAASMCLFFFLIEVIGGLLSGSLAVLSDAAHLAADLSAFAVAISGSHIASLPASETHTFGLKRIESLAALFSMISLALLSIGLAVEAIKRLWTIVYYADEATQVDGKLMSTIAFIGVIVNIILAFILGEDHIHMPGADHGHDHSHDHHGHDHSHDHHDDHSHDHHDDHSHDHHDDHSHDHHGHDHSHDHHGHDHSHDHHDDHSHDHNDEETAKTPLLHSPTDGCEKHVYSSTNEIQHLDEILPEGAYKHGRSAENRSKTHTRNVNLHAAYLHVLADLTQSVVVFVAGLIIWWKPTWQLADPICTLIFSVLVCWSTVGVIRSSLSVLLEEVPPGVSWIDVYDAISRVPGVKNVHDLHIWSISHGSPILSVHAQATDIEQALHDIKAVCDDRNISHLTIQLQPISASDCVTCKEEPIHQCR